MIILESSWKTFVKISDYLLTVNNFEIYPVLYIFTLKEIDTKSYKEKHHFLKNPLTVIDFITYNLGTWKNCPLTELWNAMLGQISLLGTLMLATRDWFLVCLSWIMSCQRIKQTAVVFLCDLYCVYHS